LERYSWRDQESRLNEALPQFRTGIAVAGSEAPVRLHFIHVRSQHANAVPLLLIPPFPFTNLSLGHLIPALTAPDDPEAHQPFHLVVPALPGLGFSDALPNNAPAVATTAELFNTLMLRLGYARYLASNAGPAAISPAQIDWKLASYLADNYPSSCVATHLIAPPLVAPRLPESPLEWLKWMIARFFSATLLGYTDDDFLALHRARAAARAAESRSRTNTLGLHEPNTLTYALCDSPIGLLVFVLMILRMMGPTKELTPAELITLTQLSWLPGPEAAMRFWAQSATPATAPADGEKTKEKSKKKAAAPRPRVGITVFMGEPRAPRVKDDPEAAIVAPYPTPHSYACPGWANAKYSVIYSKREAGYPGLLVWERPEIVVQGARDVAKAALASGAKFADDAEAATAALERVVVVPPRNSGSGSGGGGPEPKERKEVKWARRDLKDLQEEDEKAGKDLSPPRPVLREGESSGSREPEPMAEKEPEEKEAEKRKLQHELAAESTDSQGMLQPPPQLGNAKARTDSPDIDFSGESPATTVAGPENSPSPLAREAI